MPFLSVIIPIYMVQPWLNACVQSVLDQGVKDLEIILVDDGSPDDCPTMCDAWVAQDTRIRVIHQQNGGLSDARNTGICAALGDYLLFLDGDDTLLPNSLSSAIEKLHSASPDVLIGHFSQTLDETGRVLFEKDCKLDPALIDGQARDTVLNELKRARMSHCAWRYFVCREFLLQNNLYFVRGLLSEDAHWTPRLLCAANRFALLTSPFYNYRVRAGSIMTTPNFRRVLNLLWIAEENSQFAQGKSVAAYAYLMNGICILLNLALQGWKLYDPSEKDRLRAWFQMHRPLAIEAAKSWPPLGMFARLLGGFHAHLLAAVLVKCKVKLQFGGNL